MELKFEEKYQDVLQNMEFAITTIYREHPELTDFYVMQALDSLIRLYDAEAKGRSAPKSRLEPLEQDIYDSVKAMCEWRMGREDIVDKDDNSVSLFSSEDEAKTLDEILACLKRIRKSVTLWNKAHGRRGYLNFVKQFVV